METSSIVDFASRDGISDSLTDLLRTGAQQLIATAVEAELARIIHQAPAIFFRRAELAGLTASF